MAKVGRRSRSRRAAGKARRRRHPRLYATEEQRGPAGCIGRESDRLSHSRALAFVLAETAKDVWNHKRRRGRRDLREKGIGLKVRLAPASDGESEVAPA